MIDICVIGAGIAGLTAAMYAQRAGLTAVVLERTMYGGQMAQSSEIANYPCVPSTDGPTLCNAIYEQATKSGAEVRFEEVTALELSGDMTWTITTAAGEIRAKAVIVANGVKRRLLGCEGEQRLSGRGVSYCATCDGAFFRKKTVAVVGGGNTALEDALFLANLCERVYLIHRRDTFRGDKVLSDAVLAKENIEPIYNANVAEIYGERSVSGARVSFNDGSEKDIEVSAVFVAIGQIPDNGLLEGLAKLDEGGYIVAGEDGKTGCTGLFTAGDCRTKQLRQIVTAAADGANAAFSAANYINTLGAK